MNSLVHILGLQPRCVHTVMFRVVVWSQAGRRTQDACDDSKR